MTSSLHLLFTPSSSSRRHGRWLYSRSFSEFAFPIPHRAIATSATLYFSAKSDRWASLTPMISGEVINHSELTELQDESDFEKLVSSNNDLFSVCGFGSLLSGMYDSSSMLEFSCCYLLVCDQCVMRFGTREEREEYISGSNQLQSRKIERISPYLRSCFSGLLWARHCQAGDHGQYKLIP